MRPEVAADEVRGTAADSPGVCAGTCRRDQRGIVGEAEVVVRREIQAVADGGLGDAGSLRAVDAAKAAAQPCRIQFAQLFGRISHQRPSLALAGSDFKKRVVSSRSTVCWRARS